MGRLHNLWIENEPSHETIGPHSLTWVNSYKSLSQHFSLSLAMATNRKIAINANFPFSHYKSIETSRCHSNESIRPTAIKIIIFVEANLTNFCQVSALFPLWFLGWFFFFNLFFFFFEKKTIKFWGLDKNTTFGRGLLKENFCQQLAF